MKRSVWKLSVRVDDAWHLVSLPIGAEIVHVACQRGVVSEVNFWAVVDTAAPQVARVFRVFGTGHTIEDIRASYVGTALTAGGDLVWHLFERLES